MPRFAPPRSDRWRSEGWPLPLAAPKWGGAGPPGQLSLEPVKAMDSHGLWKQPYQLIAMDTPWRHVGRISHFAWHLLSSISKLWNYYSIMPMTFHLFFRDDRGELGERSSMYSPNKQPPKHVQWSKLLRIFGDGHQPIIYWISCYIMPIVSARMPFMVWMTIPYNYTLQCFDYGNYGTRGLSTWFIPDYPSTRYCDFEVSSKWIPAIYRFTLSDFGMTKMGVVPVVRSLLCKMQSGYS